MELAKFTPETLALVEKSTATLARCEHAMKVWGRSRSAMTLKNIVVATQRMPMRMMRQVGAELIKKQNAMIEAKYTVLKRRKQAEIKRHEAETEFIGPKHDLLIIEAEELEQQAKMVEAPYIGAMREVEELGRLHDALEAQIRKEYGKFDEEVFEMEEAKYWVMRAIDQSMRDVRQSGVILAGNQELLQQIGLDPAQIQVEIKAFLDKPITTASDANIEAWLKACADAFYKGSAEKLKSVGLPDDLDTSYMMLESGE